MSNLKNINEVVFADKTKINDKKKTIGITYSTDKRASNNANVFDKLGTEEMDQDNANTLEVPLKGGLISYNITDIKGTEIMHYFKKKWTREQRATIDVKDNEGNKNEYELEMENSQEREFINRFVKKVEFVINAWINKNKKQNIDFTKLSILPVDSTSSFNKKFVSQELIKLNINGLSCQMVNPEIIKKELKNLQRDEEFIEKNKSFYNSDFALSDHKQGTINQRVDNIVRKNNALKIVNDKVNEINEKVNVLLNFIQNSKKSETLSRTQIKNLIYNYTRYVDLIRECYSITYVGAIDNTKHSLNHEEIINSIKYSKGPSIDKRSSLLWQKVKPYLRGEKSPIDGKSYEEMPLCYWKKSDFEIKSLRNSERLGLKNIYNVNSDWDEEKLQKELNKIKGTILLIFDDNISGGATLSDVCYQCKELGMENIIPITFGKMSESNTMRGLVLNTPKNGYDFSTNNNLSLYTGEKKQKRKYTKKDNTLTSAKENFIKQNNINLDNQTLNILWLDDQREPYNYFSKNSNSGAWMRNHNFYSQNVFNKYNPNFIWVKNLNEFKNYIINNGLPNMVSFDHDIKPKNFEGEYENGADVANWLIKYCQQNNLKLPWCFAHSANKNGIEKINKIINNYKINENKMTNKMLKKIVSESIKKILFENMENITMDTLEEIVGYKYYPDEPHKFIDDFEMMVKDVLSTAIRKNNGEELLFDTDYPECNPDMVGTYINVYRNQMNNDFMKIYNELREKQSNANKLLDDCVQLFTQYKQSNR